MIRRFHRLLGCLTLAGCSSTSGLSADAMTAREAELTAADLKAAAPLPCAGERLAYGITLAGLPVGSAEFFTERVDGGWQLQLVGATNALVDWFCAVRGVACSNVGDDGRATSFALWIDEDGERSARSLAYDEIPTLWFREDGAESWHAELTQYARPRDPLSLLQELRRLAPSADARDFEVAMTLRSFCYRARFLGRADVDTGAGDFERALLWRVEVRPYDALDELRAEPGAIVGFYEVAISADARRLPVKVTRAFGFGEVSLELTRAGVDEAGPAVLTAARVAGAARE